MADQLFLRFTLAESLSKLLRLQITLVNSEEKMNKLPWKESPGTINRASAFKTTIKIPLKNFE